MIGEIYRKQLLKCRFWWHGNINSRPNLFLILESNLFKSGMADLGAIDTIAISHINVSGRNSNVLKMSPANLSFVSARLWHKLIAESVVWCKGIILMGPRHSPFINNQFASLENHFSFYSTNWLVEKLTHLDAIIIMPLREKLSTAESVNYVRLSCLYAHTHTCSKAKELWFIAWNYYCGSALQFIIHLCGKFI